MSRKSFWQKRKDRRIAWSRNANAAKERKRMLEAAQSIEVGVILFSGAMFRGVKHTLRILHTEGESLVMLEVDGRPWKPASVRGVRALIAKRIMA